MGDCFNQSVRRARKPHRCCECYSVIQPGEEYDYYSGVFEGRPWSYRRCDPCGTLAADEQAHLDVYDDCIQFGGLYQHLMDGCGRKEMMTIPAYAALIQRVEASCAAAMKAP